MKKRSPKIVLGRNADKAAMMRVTHPGYHDKEPGWFINNRVSKEDREVLKQLQSDDIKNDAYRSYLESGGDKC